MGTYVIGDIHGHYQVLSRLLKKFHFRPRLDRIWLVGDLVNRGPQSLEVLRWARGLGDQLVAVLGNHDLYLLGRALGAFPRKKSDTLSQVLAAPDREELIHWLLHRPLAHQEDEFLLVHAGVLPDWDLAETLEKAAQVERMLRGPGAREFLQAFLKHELSDSSVGRWCRILAEIRICSAEGIPRWGFVGSLKQVPEGTQPWFSFRSRRTRGVEILFGHWSTLGYHQGPGVRCLDSGCTHGGSLTALRLEDGKVFQARAGTGSSV